MNDWIILTSQTVAALSLAAALMIGRGCRKREREKDRLLARAVREQQQLIRELVLTRSERQRLWQAFTAKRPDGKNGAKSEIPADTELIIATHDRPIKP